MSNPSKQKGTSFERLIANYLMKFWDDRIDRRVLGGATDKGDIANWRIGKHRLVAECKNVKVTNLTGWVKEAQQEAVNDGALAGVVIHKRRGTAEAAEQFVTMTLDDFITILHASRSADD